MPRVETLIQRADGGIDGVDARRLYELPFSLLTNRPNNFVVIPANSSSPFTAMTLSGEGPAEICAFACERTAPCRVFMQMQDGTRQRGLMNKAVHIDCLFGNGQLPYPLPETLYVDELHSLVVNFTDLSGAGNQAALNLKSGRYLALRVDPYMEEIRRRMEGEQYMSNPYFYTFDNGFVDVGAGATVQATISVGQEYHFLMRQFSVVATSNQFNINIVDDARGESLIDAPGNTNRTIAANLLLGTNNYPYILPAPRFINLGQKLIVTLTDRSGAPNRIYMAIGGRNIKDRMWR
jgi:hypothetical protein